VCTEEDLVHLASAAELADQSAGALRGLVQAAPVSLLSEPFSPYLLLDMML